MLLVLGGVFVLYALTAPRSVVLEDDGEFVMSVYYLGVAHPPGYPLYVLLSHPFTWLPIGSVAYRVHLASAFFGAASCAVIWWIVRSMTSRHASAYVAALALGVSGAFWSQAIIADVYALNVLLFVLMLALCLLYVATGRDNQLLAVALLAGLSLGNHWPLMVLAFPGLLLVLWPALDKLRERWAWLLPRAVLLFLAGLLPYAWMVVRSQVATDVAFAGAIRSWGEFSYYVRRGPYADASPSASSWDRVQFGGFLVRESLAQFTALGALFVTAGVASQLRRPRRSLLVALATVLLLTPGALLAFRSVDYEPFARAITRVYPLIPYTVMAIWMGMGFDWVVARFSPRKGHGSAALAAGLGAMLIGVVFASHLTANNRRDFDLGRAYATTILSTLDQDATLFVRGDFTSRTTQYMHFVEGLRPDVRLLHSTGLGMALDGRLLHERVGTSPMGTLTEESRQARILDFVLTSSGPIYFTGGEPPTVSDFDYGFYTKVDRASEGQTHIMVDPDLLAFFRQNWRPEPADDEITAWFRNDFVESMVPILTAWVEFSAPSAETAAYRADLEAVSASLGGLLAQAGMLEAHGGSPERILELLRSAEGMAETAITKHQHASIFLHKGRALKALGRQTQARMAFERSIAIHPHPTNAAYDELRTLAAGDTLGNGGPR